MATTHPLDFSLQNCIKKQSCSINMAPEVFGGDPCPNTMKKLSFSVRTTSMIMKCVTKDRT
ncbi:D-galactoside/L-rhamnose binding SUEL lectin domain [Dillenia turbinata]|uniref:D-galactoside/L-rhamnose binding SUEL lectin domain n=1 Tax=Dillenia turbinata TaxID=194707 RepID=A0AAN8WF51_9MAGN